MLRIIEHPSISSNCKWTQHIISCSCAAGLRTTFATTPIIIPLFFCHLSAVRLCCAAAEVTTRFKLTTKAANCLLCSSVQIYLAYFEWTGNGVRDLPLQDMLSRAGWGFQSLRKFFRRRCRRRRGVPTKNPPSTNLVPTKDHMGPM